MDLERQQETGYQLELFPAQAEPVHHGRSGADGISSARFEGSQWSTVSEGKRALTQRFMEAVCDRDNLLRAYKRVKSNRGSAGVDGMTVHELGPWLGKHHGALIASLLDGSYRPQPVLGVQIPKPGGGMRQLGIPAVVDRLVQQAILQVLEPILDPQFSPSSFGFRPGRGAHDALRQASGYVAEGRCIVVDLDLEKFFDRVNHDILMSRLARHVGDKRLLRLVRRFLQAGMMSNGVCMERREGTPQGGPLSPILANLLLDELDKELERRGHCFCRYADDCNIYVRTKVAGERVMESVTQFLEKKLRLKVNREKSAVAYIEERKFLGYRLRSGGRLGIAPKSIERMKARVRDITRRNRGVRFERVLSELRSYLTGWVNYFRLAQCRNHLRELDEWIRRKMRCFRLKQCKRAKAIHDFLHRLGVPSWRAWITALSGKGWWRLAGSPSVHEAMSNQWLQEQGLIDLSQHYNALQH